MAARLDQFYTNPDLARHYADRVIAAQGAAVDCFWGAGGRRWQNVARARRRP